MVLYEPLNEKDSKWKEKAEAVRRWSRGKVRSSQGPKLKLKRHLP